MLVKDIMKRDVATCATNITVREAAKKLSSGHVGCLIVVEHGSVQGIVTKSDVVRCLADRKDIDLCRAGDIMGKSIKSCTPEMNDQSAAKMLSDNRIKRLPVISDGKLEGVVSISELVPALNKDVEEISALFWK